MVLLFLLFVVNEWIIIITKYFNFKCLQKTYTYSYKNSVLTGFFRGNHVETITFSVFFFHFYNIIFIFTELISFVYFCTKFYDDFV